MIKFFRNIRKSLLIANKTSKYLKYAIGEIALVMIGILLALQVNNWNENRLLKKSELKILQQLNIDLRTNLDELQGIYAFIGRSRDASGKLIDHLNQGKPITDSLKVWTELTSSGNIFNNANTTYKNLENSEKNIISNDSLRLRITLMYERQFFNVHTRERMMNQEYMPHYKEVLLRHFKVSKSFTIRPKEYQWEVNTPIDIKALQKNEHYKNVLVELYNFRTLRLRWLKEALKELEQLIADIDQEIKKLQ